ncbi:uncharacterized protein LOC144102342 [Amblyomma americanum]
MPSPRHSVHVAKTGSLWRLGRANPLRVLDVALSALSLAGRCIGSSLSQRAQPPFGGYHRTRCDGFYSHGYSCEQIQRPRSAIQPAEYLWSLGCANPLRAVNVALPVLSLAGC